MMLLPFDFQRDPYLILDFSATNPHLTPEPHRRTGRPGLDLTDTAAFTDYVFGKLRAAGATIGVGGYNEHRIIYRRSPHFNALETEPPYDRYAGAREIHLGIDFWTDAGTPVFAPMDGAVHSFQDNANFGDYGPTIILEHDGIAAGRPLVQSAASQPRYSLYGHLTRESLHGLYEGKQVKAGEKFAEIGHWPENGDWPPHLHFQLMTDMRGLRGDFPGVCSLADRETFLAICPDPNTLLKIPGL